MSDQRVAPKEAAGEGAAGRCPKCGGEMAAGFISGTTVTGSASWVQRWWAGTLVRGFWKVRGTGGESRELQATRCTGCGFVEFYAP